MLDAYVRTSDTPVQSTKKSSLHFSHELQLEDFEYAASDEPGVTSVLQSEKLLIRPRRFLIFNIKSVNEAVLFNVDLRTCSFEKETETAGIPCFENVLPFTESSNKKQGRHPAFGLVSRALVSGLVWRAYRAKQRIFVLKAGYAVIDPKKQRILFSNAVFHDLAADIVIESARMVWEQKAKVFVFPGQYVKKSAAGVAAGLSLTLKWSALFQSAD